MFSFNVSHLVSLVPICCLDSSLSSSVCMGRMFFSSSSLLEGRLLSLMARESFLSTFCAREPKPKHRDQGKCLGRRADLQQNVLYCTLWILVTVLVHPLSMEWCSHAEIRMRFHFIVQQELRTGPFPQVEWRVFLSHFRVGSGKSSTAFNQNYSSICEI